MTELMTILERYMAPDPYLRDPRPEPDSLADTLPSVSSRTISLHSAVSVHGWGFFDGRKVWYEAEIELVFALLARMRPDVAEIAEQPPLVTYIDDHGHQRWTVFDFLLKMKDGTRGFVAVKPFALVKETGIDRVVELTAEQLPTSLVDWVVLFTDQDLSAIDLFNAGAIPGRKTMPPWLRCFAASRERPPSVNLRPGRAWAGMASTPLCGPLPTES